MYSPFHSVNADKTRRSILPLRCEHYHVSSPQWNEISRNKSDFFYHFFLATLCAPEIKSLLINLNWTRENYFAYRLELKNCWKIMKFMVSASVACDGLETDDDITLMWSSRVSQERRRWTCNFLRRSLWKMVLNGLRMSDVCFSEVDGTIEISKWAACWFQSRFFAFKFMREPSSRSKIVFEVQKANIKNADDSINCRLLVCNNKLINKVKNL